MTLCMVLALLLSGETREEQAVWDAYYQTSAAKYEFREASGSERFQLVPKALHKYKQAQNDQMHGSIFLWTQAGVPRLVGSVWSYRTDGQRRVVHEFQSLASGPLNSVAVGEYEWQSSVPGIKYLPLEAEKRPSQNKRLRLIQMRGLARKFTGYTHPKEKDLELRLLEQPLYRYEPRGDQVIDGAMFGLFYEWDPEVILLIEAHQSKDGPRWRFAAARFNVCPLWLTQKGTTVWKVDNEDTDFPRFGSTKGPFFAVHGVDAKPLDFARRKRESSTPPNE